MLLDNQKAFAKALPLLINKAHEMGYEVTLGDAYRDPRLHGPVGTKLGYGAAYSRHKQRLAIDLNLYKNGQYLTNSKDHLPLGLYWQSIGGVWGGYQDGNHYQWPLG